MEKNLQASAPPLAPPLGSVWLPGPPIWVRACSLPLDTVPSGLQDSLRLWTWKTSPALGMEEQAAHQA